MEKQYFRIKDIASIKSGKRLPAGHLFSDEPTSHPYIRSRDIKMEEYYHLTWHI